MHLEGSGHFSKLSLQKNNNSVFLALAEVKQKGSSYLVSGEVILLLST